MAKNMARTARSQLEGQHLLFGEYSLRSRTTLNVHYRRWTQHRWRWACFSYAFTPGIILNEYMIKQLLNSAFVSYEELCVIRLGLRPRRITPFSISVILHMIVSLIHELLINIFWPQMQRKGFRRVQCNHDFRQCKKKTLSDILASRFNLK